MSKILKNTTASDIDILDIGLTVPASGQLSLNPGDFDDASDSDDLIGFVGDGSIVINDGSVDLEKADGVRLIQGSFPNAIGIAGADGSPGPSGFGIYAFANVIGSSGVVNKGRGVNVSRTGTGNYAYTFTTPTPDANYIVNCGFENIGTNTDANWFVDSKTVNGFILTTGIGDNGTAPDTLTDLNHGCTILGDAGPQGITSAYESWIDIGNVGTEADFIATLVGPQGIQGDAGPQGPPGSSSLQVSPNDATLGFLEDKIVAENNKISVTTINDGADEDLQIGINPGNIGTSEFNNDANFIDSAGAPVQPSDLSNFETTTQLNTRDTNNRNRANHIGSQLASTISDFTSAVQAAETDTVLGFNAGTNILSFTNESGVTTNIDLSLFLDDTNLSRISSGVLNAVTGVCTFTRDDLSTFDVDFSSLNDQSFINAAVATHETSITNHDDVNTSGAVVGDKLQFDGSNWFPFKDYKAFSRLTAPLVNDTTTIEEALTLPLNIPETGNYEVIVNYGWSYDINNTDILVTVNLDNSIELHFHRQEPKDSAGTGYIATNVNGGTDNTGTDQRYCGHYHDVINLTAGVHNIDLDFSAQIVDIEASILRASIIVKRFN